MYRLVIRVKAVASWFRGVTFRWARPEPTDVVIFESTNSDYLVPLCGGNSFFIFDIAGKVLWLNLPLLGQMLLHIVRGVGLRSAYATAFLRQLNPSIVITFIDNSDFFYNVARLNDSKMRFLAIQNGARYDVVEMPIKMARRIYIPEFACFGEYEKELYVGKGAHVGYYMPIGSLRESYFRRYWAEAYPSAEVEYQYDLCVVAEASPGWDLMYPGFEDAIGNIAKYAVRLAREKGLKLVIAGKRDKEPASGRAAIHQREAELSWYYKYIGSEIEITPRVRDQFTTYQLISRSRLSVASMSTALREAAGRGCRVMFCNFTQSRVWDFCEDGIWSLNQDSYEAFESRVMYLLGMSPDAWSKASSNMASRVMKNDDENPTYIALKKVINNAVLNKPM